MTEETAPRLLQLFVPLDIDGSSHVRAWDATGMFGTASHDLVLTNVRVPLADIVVQQPANEPLCRDEADTQTFFTLLSAFYHGVALSAHDELLRHLTAHVPSSLGASLATILRIQEGIGHIEVLLTANKRLLT